MNQLSFGVKIDGATQAKAELQEIIRMQQQLGRGKSGSATDLLGGISASSIMRSPELLTELRKLTAGKALVPPVIAPPVIPQAKGLNFSQLAAGAALTPFHPFSAARGISAGLGLGSAGTVPVLAALTLAAVTLTTAFVELKKAVNEGAELYQHAARLGLEVGKTAQLEALSRTIGLNKSELDALAIQGSHIRHGGRSQSFFQQSDLRLLLGGAGTGQLGALQQVKNMSDYITRTFRDTAVSVRIIAEDAKAMQELKYSFGVVSLQIQAVFSDLITLALPLIKQQLENIISLIMFSTNILHAAVQGAQKLGLVPSGSPGTSHIQAGRSGGPQLSPWERMGFVIGGFGQADYARKTAENTAEIAKHTKGMNDKLQGLIPFGGKPAADPTATHTFYHKFNQLP